MQNLLIPAATAVLIFSTLAATTEAALFVRDASPTDTASHGSCPTETHTGEICPTCVVPKCLRLETITLTANCDCPTPIPTFTKSFPCGEEEEEEEEKEGQTGKVCAGLGCGTSYTVVTTSREGGSCPATATGSALTKRTDSSSKSCDGGSSRCEEETSTESVRLTSWSISHRFSEVPMPSTGLNTSSSATGLTTTGTTTEKTSGQTTDTTQTSSAATTSSTNAAGRIRPFRLW